jgi:hypothetical protein
MNTLISLPITSCMPVISQPIIDGRDTKAEVARLEQAVDLLRTRHICYGWKMDESGAERALRYFRAGCPDDDEEWVAALSFISKHSLSLDWICDGDVGPMICTLASRSKRAAMIAGTPDDPIFAAVAAHRTAYTAFDQCLTRQNEFSEELPEHLRQSNIDVWETKIVKTDDPRWIAVVKEVRRLSEEEESASIALIHIEPTTLLGAAHLMGYVVEREARGDEWPRDLIDDDAPPAKFGKPWAHFLHRNLAEFIGRMAAA